MCSFSCCPSGRIRKIVAVCLCLGTFGCRSTAQEAPAAVNATITVEESEMVGTVLHVVDGDTFDVRLSSGSERVRLIGVDTPETKKPNTPVQCFGPEASARLSSLLSDGTPVKLLRDAELRDTYGRLLAYTFRAEDNLFINLTLVEEGFAVPLEIAPNTTFATDVAAAASAARRANRGLWSACPERPAAKSSGK